MAKYYRNTKFDYLCNGMLSIWHNPRINKFYIKYIFDCPYEVGYKDRQDHELVALFYIDKNKLYPCMSWNDFYFNIYLPNNPYKEPLRKRIRVGFFNFCINFLQDRRDKKPKNKKKVRCKK